VKFFFQETKIICISIIDIFMHTESNLKSVKWIIECKMLFWLKS
jgi:hypothetical protein